MRLLFAKEDLGIEPDPSDWQIGTVSLTLRFFEALVLKQPCKRECSGT